MNRVTSSELFHTQQPTIVRENCSISSLFFTDDHIFLIETTSLNVLRKMTLKNFKVVQNIQLTEIVAHSQINSLAELANFIVFALTGSNDLHYINSKRQFIKVPSHIHPINQVISYRDSIATCSDDFTVRIWNQEKDQLTPSKTKHAYFGHTGKVTCFQKYEDVLISGSQDQTVIFWRKDENHCTFKANSPVKNVLACVLNWSKIAKNKKAEVNRVIKYSPERMDLPKTIFGLCNEIDDSFAWFSDGNAIVFVEINLGEIITKKELCLEKEGKVINSKSIGRMLLFGKGNDSMYLLRF